MEVRRFFGGIHKNRKWIDSLKHLVAEKKKISGVFEKTPDLEVVTRKEEEDKWTQIRNFFARQFRNINQIRESACWICVHFAEFEKWQPRWVLGGKQLEKDHQR